MQENMTGCYLFYVQCYYLTMKLFGGSQYFKSEVL